ncbi:POK9 protein, partial [Donacobius atricapilla]|nr:POK9 protein [Donacobius atricapilla]
VAAAFAAAKAASGTSAVCYSCDKPSHFKKDCFAQKEAKPKAPNVCLRCRKGHHFANQCRSKYDSEGCPIQGNQNQRAGQRRAPTQIIQPPMQMLPPQMPAPQAQPPRIPNEEPPQVFA